MTASSINNNNRKRSGLYLVLVVAAVCRVHTARHAQRFATRVAEQLERLVGVLVTPVRRKLHQNFQRRLLLRPSTNQSVSLYIIYYIIFLFSPVAVCFTSIVNFTLSTFVAR